MVISKGGVQKNPKEAQRVGPAAASVDPINAGSHGCLDVFNPQRWPLSRLGIEAPYLTTQLPRMGQYSPACLFLPRHNSR